MLPQPDVYNTFKTHNWALVKILFLQE